MESRFGWGRRANREEEEKKNEGGEEDEVYDDDSSSQDDEGGAHQNSTPGGSRIPCDPSHMFNYSAEATAETQQAISTHELQQVI